MLATIGLSFGGLGALYLTGVLGIGSNASAETLVCQSVRIIDGDTFDCGSIRIRMQGIDSPEMPGHCRPGRECTPGEPYASTANLRRLTAAGNVQCRKTDVDAYGRTVARCTAGKADLSCAQIEGGFAVRRYGMIWC